MNDFITGAREHQVKWREKNLPKIIGCGMQNRVRRAWILPKEHKWKGLWLGIEDSLRKYIDGKIQEHGGVHNLLSSWMLCANLYFPHFPFREHSDLLAGFLRHFVDARISSIEAMELEYEEKKDCLKPQELLGEPEKPDLGKRGSHQTSPDLGIVARTVSGSLGLILVENKFTEHSFYSCSGRKKEYRSPDDPKAHRCFDIRKVLRSPEVQCRQMTWEQPGRPNRRYWAHLQFSSLAREKLNRCPAATAGYQLFRQQALAEALANTGKYEFVVSAVAYDQRNEVLKNCLNSSGVADFTTGWAELLNGKAGFATWTHQDWVKWVRSSGDRQIWANWLQYVNKRYGY